MIRFSMMPLVFLIVSACGEPMQYRSEFALGTRVAVRLAPVSGRNWRADLDTVYRKIASWERILDPNRKVSLLAAFNRGEKDVFRRSGGRLLRRIIFKGLRHAGRTRGFFDPFILPMTRLWGFSSPLPRKTPPSVRDLQAARSVSGYRKVFRRGDRIQLPRGGGFDGGGFVKGWAADRIRDCLVKWGYAKAVIDAGGDVVLIGRRPAGYGPENGWIVMIAHPERSGKYWCSLLVRDLAVVTSGNYERYFEYRGRRYHHLLDPADGYPASGCVSVTVTGPSAEIADVLATALFVAGPERGMKLLGDFPGYSAMLLYKKKGRTVAVFSPGFRKKFRYRPIR